MNSPFPGMDLFLEEPSGLSSVHHWLMSVMGEMLIAQVAPHYSVKIEERVYSTDDASHLFAAPLAASFSFDNTPIATPPPLIERLPALETRDRYLTIYDRCSRELVTIIELLSLWNKVRGTRGRREFVAKRETKFSTRTHWVEPWLYC